MFSDTCTERLHRASPAADRRCARERFVLQYIRVPVLLRDDPRARPCTVSRRERERAGHQVHPALQQSRHLGEQRWEQHGNVSKLSHDERNNERSV